MTTKRPQATALVRELAVDRFGCLVYRGDALALWLVRSQSHAVQAYAARSLKYGRVIA